MKVIARIPTQILLTMALCLFLLVGMLSLAGCKPESEDGTSADESPHIVAKNQIEAGRYLVTIGQCNDCHTSGFLETDGKVPEENWLTGSPIGWRGPWGTTYPPNLRLRVQEWTEDAWVQTLHTRKALPPMPWANVNQFSEQDARAIYQYIKSLGPKGTHMPTAVPAGVEPATAYRLIMPQGMQTAGQKNLSN